MMFVILHDEAKLNLFSASKNHKIGAAKLVCIRGRASPDQNTKLRLFSSAGGFCQNPKCNRTLFPEEGDSDFHIAEMAHIIAASDKGPRANTKIKKEKLGLFDNLILLCPTCHTIIDKNPKEYPQEEILDWKSEHISRISRLFGAVKYETRSEARKSIEPILLENRKIHQKYGPDNEYKYNPEAEEALMWKRKVLSHIIPNNRKLLLILDANRNLMKSDEKDMLEEFRQHLDDLEAKHIVETHNTSARFPRGFEAILGD